jgi:AcrR family transcriptional regulator
MKIPASRAPGRPRGFEEFAALDAATQVFWARGYGDASLDNLTEAMGLTRPSLYGAFGDKQGLYLKCVERYGRWVEQAVGQALRDHPDRRAALRRMFTEAIGLYTQPAPEPRGCLLASASQAEAALSRVARDAVARALGGVESAIEAYYGRSGSAPDEAGALARLTVTFLCGLASRARLGTPAATLIGDAHRFTDLLAEPPLDAQA